MAIAFPAYFNDGQRQDTKDAGEGRWLLLRMRTLWVSSNSWTGSRSRTGARSKGRSMAGLRGLTQPWRRSRQAEGARSQAHPADAGRVPARNRRLAGALTCRCWLISKVALWSSLKWATRWGSRISKWIKVKHKWFWLESKILHNHQILNLAWKMRFCMNSMHSSFFFELWMNFHAWKERILEIQNFLMFT